MKAVILCAGKGTRLKPWTDYMPKPLFKVKNKPLIEYNIELLISQNITDITLIIGYKAKKFEYLKDKYKNINLNFVYNDKYNEYNNWYSLYMAKNIFNAYEDVLILDGDIIVNIPFIIADYTQNSCVFIQQSGIAWTVDFNDKSRQLKKINFKDDNSGYRIADICFLKKNITETFIRYLKNSNGNDYYEYSIQSLIDSGEIIYVSLLKPNSIYEIDSLRDAIDFNLITEEEFYENLEKIKKENK